VLGLTTATARPEQRTGEANVNNSLLRNQCPAEMCK